MRDAGLNRAFVRFRDRGDGAALARVFDATARELLGVAAHLAPDPSTAEDLVQQTFVVAIERKGDFDAARRLRPWLYGILARCAAKARREQARRPEPDRLDARAPAEPWQEAASAEVPAALDAALARLPDRYRRVLGPYLREGRRAEDIAAELGTAPGTVRSQIHRGLDRLRRLLPREMTGAHAALALSARGLADLRAQVLEHAGVGAAAAAAPGTAALLTAPKVAAGVVALALGAGALRMLDARGPEPEPGTSTAVVAPRPASAPGVGTPSARAAVPDDDEPDGRHRPPVRWHVFDGPPDVVGRVVDEDGAPVAAAPVRAVHGQDPDGPSLLVRSDAGGGFALGGLDPGWWFLSVDDPRFARTWWREAAAALPERDARDPDEPAAVRLELHRPRRAAGTVVDARGAPVAGVLVTVAREHVAGRERPAQGHLTNALVAARADDAGRFELGRLRPGTATLVLDHPDFARTLATVEVPSTGARVEIDDGLVAEGVVLAGGEPLADAALVATQPSRAHLPMAPAGRAIELRTGADGGFRVDRLHSFPTGIDAGFATVTIAVRHPDWAGCVALVESDRALPRARLACVRRADEPDPDCLELGRNPYAEARHRGEAVGGGSLVVTVADDPRLPEDADLGAQVWRLEPRDPYVFRREGLGPDRSRLFEALPAGRYSVYAYGSAAGAAGLNFPPREVVLADEEQGRIELAPGDARLSGAIRDASGVRAAGHVSARPVDAPGWPGDRAAIGRLDATGYVLDGLVPGRWRLSYEADNVPLRTFDVRLAPGENHFDAVLVGGRIEGRLVDVELPPEREGAPGPVCVFPRGWGTMSGNRGLFLHPEADGTFVAEHLEPGPYNVFVRTPRGLVLADVELSEARPVARVELRHPADPATIRGRLDGYEPSSDRFGQQPVSVAAWPRDVRGFDFGTADWATVDAEGTFELRHLAPGEYALLVCGDDREEGAWASVWRPGIVLIGGEDVFVPLAAHPGRSIRIHLEHGDESAHPRRIGRWKLEMPDGTWIPFGPFVGSTANGEVAPERPFALDPGRYRLEVDFGDAPRVLTAIDVEPGDGVQDIVVRRP